LNIGKNIEGSVKIITSGDWKDIRLENFPAGSIVIFKTEPDTTAAQSMENILSSLELSLFSFFLLPFFPPFLLIFHIFTNGCHR